PNATQFLTRDILNINKFFSKKGINVYDLDKALKVVKKD
ncbi:MAG: serine protein kinase RIO, partial [Thaumarchaeota archaeon]|nr:serine protein kinase RIO [Nitrososphaerota archaeon]